VIVNVIRLGGGGGVVANMVSNVVVMRVPLLGLFMNGSAMV